MRAKDQSTGVRRPGRPRKEESSDTKAALRRAALRLFARHGYNGASIRAIAREVGLSESVLYAHFASKRAIFDAVLAELGPQNSAEIVTGAPRDFVDTDPARYLAELVAGLLEQWDSADARLLISLMTKDGLLHDPVLQQALSAMRASTAGLFERWIAAGLIPTDLGSPQDLALSFTGPIGLIRVMHLHAGADADERAAAREAILRHVDVFARAVLRRVDGGP